MHHGKRLSADGRGAEAACVAARRPRRAALKEHSAGHEPSQRGARHAGQAAAATAGEPRRRPGRLEGRVRRHARRAARQHRPLVQGALSALVPSKAVRQCSVWQSWHVTDTCFSVAVSQTDK